MVQSHCDFTILYRELGNVAHLFATYDHAPATASTATTAAAVPGDLAPKTSQAPSQATKQATMAVPSSPEISLFPNIAFASSNGGGAGIAVGGAGESIASASITTEQALTILSAAFYDPTLLVCATTSPYISFPWKYQAMCMGNILTDCFVGTVLVCYCRDKQVQIPDTTYRQTTQTSIRPRPCSNSGWHGCSGITIAFGRTH